MHGRLLALSSCSNFSGNVTFVYTVTDSQGGGTDTATVTIVIPALPDAVNDAYNTTAGTPITGRLLDNDSGPGGASQLQVTSIGALSNPAAGTITGGTPGGNFTFTPAPGFTGEGAGTFLVGQHAGTSQGLPGVSPARTTDPHVCNLGAAQVC